jgi:hypothetical protein
MVVRVNVASANKRKPPRKQPNSCSYIILYCTARIRRFEKKFTPLTPPLPCGKRLCVKTDDKQNRNVSLKRYYDQRVTFFIRFLSES